MSDHPFHALPDRGKEPTSKRNLDAWISRAVSMLPDAPLAERRLSWLVASSVVVAALQQALHTDGLPRFLLNGGAYLEVRLGLKSRATADVDTLFRGSFDDFLEVLDSVLTTWGTLTLQRTEIEVIEGARRVVKPRRFRIQLLLGGAVWRAIDIEVAPDEGGAGDRVETVPATPLHHFGLPSAVELAGIAMDYQVAQKLHACSDPHQPPEFVNDRARDIVDLVLIRDAFYGDAYDLPELRRACEALFEARQNDTLALGGEPRGWPPPVVAYEDWQSDFAKACDEAGVTLDLDTAVAEVNEWIATIANR